MKMARKTGSEDGGVTFERRSDNVFADLKLPDAAELNNKLMLAMRLNERISARGWKQAEVAKRLGIAQPNVSALRRYRLDNFSLEKLMAFFNALGYGVELLIRPAGGKRRGAMRLLMVA